MNGEGLNESGSAGSASLPYAVGVVLSDEDESTPRQSGGGPGSNRNQHKKVSDSDLGLGLSKRWGDQDGDWPVSAAPPPLGGHGKDDDGVWSAKIDEDVKNRWADEYLWDIPAESSVFKQQTSDLQEQTELTQKNAVRQNSILNKTGESGIISTGRAPGVYEVRDGVGGFLFGRASVENANTADDDYSQYSDYELFDTRVSRWRVAVCMVCVAVVCLAIGIGVVALARDSDGAQVGEQSGRDAGGAQCNFSGILQPDPFLQCACNGNMTTISDSLQTRYHDLLRGFLPLVDPDPYKDIITTQSSCEPYNVALMWLALDSLGKSDDFKVMTNRYALAVLYAEWGGTNWEKNEGWLSQDEQECNWYGVHCKRPFSVSGLQLSGNYLKGTIPSEIEMLQDLIKLDVSNNNLEGTLPEELYNITTLEDLILWDNEFEGTISSSIGSLTNLQELLLDNNHFSGTLPTELSFLDKMIWFMVHMNDFTGDVFGIALSWPNIVGLTIGGNAFSGTIPELLGMLQTGIRVFDLSGTELEGTLPSELGNLVEMEEFSMDGYNIGGTIPTEIGNWKNLKQIAMTHGRLGGSIPTELGKWKFAEKIFLNQNSISGVIPTELGLCTQLQELDLGSNEIEGQIPTELGALGQLEKFNLGWTLVTGSAPSGICALHQNVGGGELVSFVAPCYDFHCDPFACCKNCCTPGCG